MPSRGVDLRVLAPALVIMQADHDEIGVPLWLKQRRVEQVVAYRTDHAIVTAGR